MKKRLIKIAEVLCSGLLGVVITLGYHFFVDNPQSFTFIYDGNEIVATESTYTDLINDMESLEKQYKALEIQYENIKLENEQLIEQNQVLMKENEDAQNTIKQMYNLDFQNLNLVINGIDSGYSNKSIIVNDETYYSQGFLQFIVDNQPVSSNNSKLFIGNVQSEDKMPVSLFELKPFTKGNSLFKATNEKDTYENIYPQVFTIRSGDRDYDALIAYATEYFIDYKYSTFSFDYAYSQNADQLSEYEIYIYGDGNLLKSITLDRKTKVNHVEVDISNVEFLQISGKCEHYGISNDNCYSLMINPYLYP